VKPCSFLLCERTSVNRLSFWLWSLHIYLTLPWTSPWNWFSGSALWFLMAFKEELRMLIDSLHLSGSSLKAMFTSAWWPFGQAMTVAYFQCNFKHRIELGDVMPAMTCKTFGCVFRWLRFWDLHKHDHRKSLISPHGYTCSSVHHFDDCQHLKNT